MSEHEAPLLISFAYAYIYDYNTLYNLNTKKEANMFGSFGTTELIIILVILLLFFGAKKLPELSKSIGSSAKELRNAMKDDDDEPKKNQES